MKILKFSAEWCNPCKGLAKVLEFIDLPYEMECYDIDSNPVLASQYQVFSVPTLLIVNDEGEVVARKVGTGFKAELERFFSYELD